jgi:hypothetical protein
MTVIFADRAGRVIEKHKVLASYSPDGDLAAPLIGSQA